MLQKSPHSLCCPRCKSTSDCEEEGTQQLLTPIIFQDQHIHWDKTKEGREQKCKHWRGPGIAFFVEHFTHTLQHLLRITHPPGESPACFISYQTTCSPHLPQQKYSTIFAFLRSISYTGVQNSMTMLIFIPFDIQIWEIFKLIEREILFSHGICVNLCKVNSRCQIMTSPRKFKNKSSRMKQIFNISKICKLYRLNKVISEFPLSSSQ